MTESHLLFHKAMSNMWKLQLNKRFKSKLADGAGFVLKCRASGLLDLLLNEKT